MIFQEKWINTIYGLDNIRKIRYTCYETYVNNRKFITESQGD